MVTFVLLAAVITIGAVALVAVPLLRQAPKELSPAPWAALGVAGVLVVGSAVLYVSWSNWSWHTASATTDSPQTMVASLARKLEQEPNDLNGWLMLGRSYTVLEQYPLALRAYERADRLAQGRNADALVGEAEALALGDMTELEGRAGRLVEQALAVEPNSGKALFFGGAAALRRGELPLARDRFAKLLTLDPPANVKPMLEQQIAAIDRQLAGEPEPAGQGARPGQPPAMAANPPGSAADSGGEIVANDAGGARPRSDAAGAGATVRINVVLSPQLASSQQDASPLFVFVRDPDRPGPPLAVKRLSSHFPQTVELSAADSMIPGRSIAAGQKVQVVARIARTGSPVGASGDPFGEIAYLVGHDGLLNIVIDRITP
jgi:cytochrome c-type biogenesis protein CcmH